MNKFDSYIIYPREISCCIYMPYTTRKVRNKKCYTNYNKKTHQVFSKCTSKKNALKQIRLLKALDNDPTFYKKLRSTRRRRNK